MLLTIVVMVILLTMMTNHFNGSPQCIEERKEDCDHLVSIDGVVPRAKSKETSVRGEFDTVHWLLTVLVHPKHLPDDQYH